MMQTAGMIACIVRRQWQMISTVEPVGYMRRLSLLVSVVAVGTILASCIAPNARIAPEIMGARPSYSSRDLTAVPNAAAMRRRIWVPSLDQGFVPQGIAVGDGALWIATYHSTDPKQDRGPCRVFKIDGKTGTLIGQFDLPPACGHAGGIAHTGGRYLYVADTRHLFRIDPAIALAKDAKPGEGSITVPLSGALRGSFLGYADGALWLGVWKRANEGPGRVWRIPEATLAARVAANTSLDEEAADRTFSIVAQTQGAAIDARGFLWLTQSGSQFGRLQKLDAQNGNVLAEYAMPAGIEDIEFAPDGVLWAVSEAGSQRWNGWTTFFPLVFEVDVAALR